MAFDKYDVEGYLREDNKLRRNEVAYALQFHEINSINEITQRLERGRIKTEHLSQYYAYLDHLEVKLSTIIITEEKEGISNVQLKSDLNNVRNLKRHVSSLLEKSTRLMSKRIN